jgi:predicted nucleic acid-binding protein
MVVVDSSVWIDLFTGRQSPASRHLEMLLSDARVPLAAPDLVLFEVLRGFRHERQTRLALKQFQQIHRPAVVTEAGAERAAERYRRLREMGITIRSSIDVLVASYCIDEDLLLLQHDRDFLPFEQVFGLRLLKPENH